jgi:hypothetical protein
MHNFTHFLSALPSLEEGEGITVTAEELSGKDSRNEEADAMAEQEGFFGANAMPDKPVCGVCGETTVRGARITPMAWGEESRGGGPARHQILLPQMPGPQQGNRRGKDRDVPDTRGGVREGWIRNARFYEER